MTDDPYDHPRYQKYRADTQALLKHLQGAQTEDKFGHNATLHLDIPNLHVNVYPPGYLRDDDAGYTMSASYKEAYGKGGSMSYKVWPKGTGEKVDLGNDPEQAAQQVHKTMRSREFMQGIQEHLRNPRHGTK